jgi:hypothetical protein
MATILLSIVLLLAKGQPMQKDSTWWSLEPGVQITGPDVQADGTRLCRVRSPYQRGPTLVRTLVPRKLEPPDRRRVLFVLPVDPAMQRRWGDGLEVARKLDLANRFGFIVVAPTFSDWPWYADHPAEPTLRQESYMLKVVVPLVGRLYPHEPGRRALVGFSKSGWGAFSLLLRNPEVFGAAAAWDSPMMMARPRFEMGRIAGTQENFERYRISRLLRERAASVQKMKRLGLFGYGSFRKDTQGAHALMEELGIPHAYADGPRRKHHWDSGWMEEAVEALRDMLP